MPSPNEVLAITATSLIPFTSLFSATIYLAYHPASPIHRLFTRRRIRLPTHRNEPLDGSTDESEKDPFNLDDPDVCQDGTPVEPERFWASMWKRKMAILVTLVLAFACNIVLLAFTITTRLEGADRIRALLVPTFLLPAHITSFLMIFAWLNQNDVSTNWPTTVHLNINLFIQWFVLSGLALLPSTPVPSSGSPSVLLVSFSRLDFVKLPRFTPLSTAAGLLPILQIIPLIIACFVRRGPPLHINLEIIYPAKITDAVPYEHQSRNPKQPNVTQEVECTVPEWFLFSFATAVVRKGYYAETMDVWDLPVLNTVMRALPNYQRMRQFYPRRRTRLPKRWEGFNLLFKLARVNRGPFIAQTSLAAATAVGYYIPHYILRLFIIYLENDPSRSDPSWGWLLAFGLFVSNAIIFLATGITWSLSSIRLQGSIKLQLNTMLFAKTLVKKDIAATSTSDEKQTKEDSDEEDDEGVSSKSQIMTLFTVDVDRVTEFVFHSFSLVDSPIELIVGTAFLVKILGPSAVFGLLAALLLMPLNHIAAKVVTTAQENLMKTRDKRTSLMNEVLQGIRMLKFMAWERSFERRIQAIRKEELHWQARNFIIEVFFGCLWQLTPVLVTAVSLLHFVLVAKHRLTPSTAFTAVAIFGELQFALNALPETFIQALQGFVSCRRIEKYMSLDEVPDIEPYAGNGDIILMNATFTWSKDDSSLSPTTPAQTPRHMFTLMDLSLRFPRNQLSLICGRLGSGKSLLLAGLLGEADLLAGSVQRPRSRPDLMSIASGEYVSDEDWVIPDQVGYVPQQAWLQNASIKDNIIFSAPWNESRYQTVIRACSLTTDLEILEDGDETEIGEKGLNLSGGQKARVSLARAMYSRAGVLYLDDVLSAVDAHTAEFLLEQCLTGPISVGRTILLVSHHTALVSPAAAYIVALDNGEVRFAGTRPDFVAGGLMTELDQEEQDAKKKAEEATIEEIEEKPLHKTHKSVVSLSNAAYGSEPGSETSSIIGEDEQTTLTNSSEEVKRKQPRKLIEDEKRAKGRIAWPVWKLYFTSLGGAFWWICMFIALVSNMLLPVVEKGWLQYWTGSGATNRDHSPLFYVGIYTAITVAGAFISQLEEAVIYIGSLRASRKLHNAMLESVLFATLRFHDTTSRGRLLNRFGKDVEGLDSSMADNFVRTISYGLSCIVTFVSMTYVGGLPFFFAFCVILVLYYQAGSIYGQTSRDMRRLDSVTRSPLYSLFGESVSGVAVIRAFGGSTIALRQMLRLADTNMLAFVWTWTVNRWLSARFNVLSSLIVGAIAVAILVSPGVDAAMAGFALAFANSIQHDLLFVVRRFVQLEQSMVALERIKEYSELTQEAAEFTDPRPRASWPEQGAIEVENLVIRYAPDLPDVLHSISFKVAPREKVGIVGATGCGKSTLALSFFRFVEATSGKITIDGMDISKIGLTDLRSRVTIIPQDPTILSGSLRSTLDVFDEYEDADIYAALRRVHLLREEDVQVGASGPTEPEDAERNKNVFRDLSNPVSEGGDNFSSGEKQLICMARAILRRNRVLLMDEATASIDYETDQLITRTIQQEFSDSTILTIAHRVQTIIQYDKVLVMDRGNVEEYASPAELLRDHKSRFYALCKATGRAEFKQLKQMATEAERARTKQ